MMHRVILPKLYRGSKLKFVHKFSSYTFKQYHNMINVTACPENCLIDEPIRVKVTGLNEKAKITLLATSFGTKKKWQSHAHYVASENECIDTKTDPSYGGDYDGIEQMGIFSSLKLPPEQYTDMSAPDFLAPHSILLEVFQGHHYKNVLKRQKSVCSVLVKRTHLSESVTRVPVRHGNIRGVMFVPKNLITCPGVIDVRGAPGVNELRPSLLATKGFVTLSLAHSDYDDLPKQLTVFDLEYFKEAVDFISGHEKVRNNVGVIGSSFGGAIALAMSGCIPNIKSVVLNCSPVFPLDRKFKFGERKWETMKMDSSKIIVSNNTVNSANVFPKLGSSEIEKFMPRFQDSVASILSIEGKADGLGHSARKHSILQDIFLKSGKTNYKFIEYEGAGHLFDVPYLPHSVRAYFNDKQPYPTYFGGNTKDHSKAQEQAWCEIINFLQLTLNTKSSKLLN